MINVLRVILPAFSTIGILHFEKAYLIIWRPDLANQKPITETNTGAIGKRMPHQSSLFGLVNTSDIRLKGAVRPVAALNSFLDRSRLGGSSSIPEAGTNSGALGTSSHPNSRNNHQSSRGGGGGETPSSNGVGGGQRESVVSALGLTHPKAIRNPSALFGGTTSQINTNNDPLVSLPPTDNPLQWDQLYTPSAQSIHIAPTSSSAPQISVKTPALVGSKHVPLIERESSLLRRQMMESNASGLDAKGKRLRSGSSGSKLVLADVSAAGMINDTSNLSVAEGGEGGEPSSNIMASMALASTNIVMLSMIGMSDGEPVEAAVKTEAMNDQNVLSKPRRKEVWEQVDE